MISTIQENSTNSVQQNYPSIFPSQTNDIYATPPLQTISTYSAYQTYTFPPTTNQNQMQNISIQYDNNSSSYTSNNLIQSSAFFPNNFSMPQIKRTKHTGLDNLSLAAEMILNSNNHPIPCDNNDNNESTVPLNIKSGMVSNECVENNTNQPKDNDINDINDNDCNEDNSVNNQQSNVEVRQRKDNECGGSSKSVLTTPESLITIRNGSALVEDTEDERTISTPVSGAVDDGRSCNFEAMEIVDNFEHEETQREGKTQGETLVEAQEETQCEVNAEALSTSTFGNESSDESQMRKTPSPR